VQRKSCLERLGAELPPKEPWRASSTATMDCRSRMCLVARGRRTVPAVRGLGWPGRGDGLGGPTEAGGSVVASAPSQVGRQAARLSQAANKSGGMKLVISLSRRIFPLCPAASNMTNGLTGVALVIGEHHRGNTLGLALHLAVVPS
jgi:hypothetical protein